MNDPMTPGPSAADRLALLSTAQREVLAFVAEHRSSKEIARALGISSHTVDQRMKRAQALLGVNSRFEAARIYSGSDSFESTPPRSSWGELVYQPSALVSEGGSEDNASSEGHGPSDARSPLLHQTQAVYGGSGSTPWYANLLESGSANTLSPWARTVVIVVLTLAAVLSLSAVVSLAEGLSRLV